MAGARESEDGTEERECIHTGSRPRNRTKNRKPHGQQTLKQTQEPKATRAADLGTDPRTQKHTGNTARTEPGTPSHTVQTPENTASRVAVGVAVAVE